MRLAKAGFNFKERIFIQNILINQIIAEGFQTSQFSLDALGTIFLVKRCHIIAQIGTIQLLICGSRKSKKLHQVDLISFQRLRAQFFLIATVIEIGVHHFFRNFHIKSSFFQVRFKSGVQASIIMLSRRIVMAPVYFAERGEILNIN